MKQTVWIPIKGRSFELTLVKGPVVANDAEIISEMEMVIATSDSMGMVSPISGRVDVAGSSFEFTETTTPEEMQVNKAVKNADQLYEALGGTVALTTKGAEAYRDVLFNGLDVDKAIEIISEENKNLWSIQRLADQNGYMQTAQKWAEKPGITPADAAHGVAYDIYCATHPFQHGVDTAKEYAKNYDDTFKSSIKDRSMKAAKELFG